MPEVCLIDPLDGASVDRLYHDFFESCTSGLIIVDADYVNVDGPAPYLTCAIRSHQHRHAKSHRAAFSLIEGRSFTLQWRQSRLLLVRLAFQYEGSIRLDKVFNRDSDILFSE